MSHKAEQPRRILMTGADSGFGYSVANHLRDRGHMLHTIGLTEKSDTQFDFLRLADRRSQIILSKIVSEIEIDDKPPDVLINNAGTIELAGFLAHMPSLYHDVWLVNTLAPYILTWSFYRHTRDHPPPNGDYRVISTTSMATRMPPRECPGYGASKSALESTMKALARELARELYVFACIAPGMVAPTPMQIQGYNWLINKRGMKPNEATRYQAGLMGHPIAHAEMCDVFEFAVERMPQAMTGTTLAVPAASGL